MVFPMKLTRLLVTALFLLCVISSEGSAQAAYPLTTVPDPLRCTAMVTIAGNAAATMSNIAIQ